MCITKSTVILSSVITIYADGSSIGNPGPGGWGAVVSFPKGIVKELGGREEHTTNNRMELQAAIEALEYALSAGEPVTLYTDSSYLINGITKWVHGWKKNGWITGAKEPVLNKELWEELHLIVEKMEITWKHSPGHAGIPGNERVDEIANNLARGENVTLFEDEQEKYSIDLSPETHIGKTTSRKTYSYLSLVNGKAENHSTWKECEARVKGVQGAKFKKAMSESEEKKILKEWGVAL